MDAYILILTKVTKKIMSREERPTIFDPIRQKRVILTPEERVRQLFVHYLVEQRGYPSLRLANEYSIRVGKLSRRCDTVVFSDTLQPLMVIEYKAPHITLGQEVVDQAFRYNSVLKVPFIILYNGHECLIYRVGYDGADTQLLPTVPTYTELLHLAEA